MLLLDFGGILIDLARQRFGVGRVIADAGPGGGEAQDGFLDSGGLDQTSILVKKFKCGVESSSPVMSTENYKHVDYQFPIIVIVN